jgi:hypothetical protein
MQMYNGGPQAFIIIVSCKYYKLQYDIQVTCDLPLTSNVIDEAVYMVNLDICLLTFEFNDDVIYTLVLEKPL